MSKKEILKLTNVSQTFNLGTPNENPVLKSIDLSVNKGDFVTIIGGNGAGKSTLLNTIAGSIKSNEGNIELRGKSINKRSEEKRAKFISRVFQDPAMGTAPRMTISENLAIASLRGERRFLKKSANKETRKQFEEMLSVVGLGLENRLDHDVEQLSGGQRQIIALLMATVKLPELLLLDEHTAALDPKAAKTVIELTEERIIEKEITTLMITHNMQHAIDYGNRLIMMNNGEIILDIDGKEKQNLTIEKLLDLFKSSADDNELSDRMLLN